MVIPLRIGWVGTSHFAVPQGRAGRPNGDRATADLVRSDRTPEFGLWRVDRGPRVLRVNIVWLDEVIEGFEGTLASA